MLHCYHSSEYTSGLINNNTSEYFTFSNLGPFQSSKGVNVSRYWIFQPLLLPLYGPVKVAARNILCDAGGSGWPWPRPRELLGRKGRACDDTGGHDGTIDKVSAVTTQQTRKKEKYCHEYRDCQLFCLLFTILERVQKLWLTFWWWRPAFDSLNEKLAPLR
jgi:hypothetical protein